MLSPALAFLTPEKTVINLYYTIVNQCRRLIHQLNGAFYLATKKLTHKGIIGIVYFAKPNPSTESAPGAEKRLYLLYAEWCCPGG